MKAIALLAGATALAALTAPAFAQTEFSTGANVTGVTTIDDRITDIEDLVTDDFDRSEDSRRFGPGELRQGLFGNMSLAYSGSDGNSNSQDLSVAGRISYNMGNFAQAVGIAIEFGENENGDKDVERTSAIYDAQYYFNDRFYAFGLGSYTVDGLVDGAPDFVGDVGAANEASELRQDAIIAVGPGYRIINNETTAWRVQAGVGVRYTQTGEQFLIDDETSTDLGYIASSRFYHRVNDQFFITNDTDLLTSDEDSVSDVAQNQLGLNFKMSDALATKLSYTTRYESEREIRTDNTVGLSIVYGF